MWDRVTSVPFLLIFYMLPIHFRFETNFEFNPTRESDQVLAFYQYTYLKYRVKEIARKTMIELRYSFVDIKSSVFRLERVSIILILEGLMPSI